jgi:Fur family transcriptional regulator, peroxide stress response regulator
MLSVSISDLLIKSGLKVTPQRIAVLEAILKLANHPTADEIIIYIKKNHPHVAIGTVYKSLETFVDKGMINKVKTESDVMRYDAILEKHHHLYCADSNRIEDYYDDELNMLIDNYFKTKKIPDFNVLDIKLQIKGNFLNNKTE